MPSPKLKRRTGLPEIDDREREPFMIIPVREKSCGAWELRIRQTAILIGRLGLACLFFSQLFWKLPPDFGCTRDSGRFIFTSVSADGNLRRTTGLCDWLGVESIFATVSVRFLV